MDNSGAPHASNDIPPPAHATQQPISQYVPPTTSGSEAVLNEKSSKKRRTPYAFDRTRLILRGAAVLAEVIAFFIVVGVSAKCMSDSSGYFGCSEWGELLFVGLALIWNAAEFITLCINRRGIHPGAHIALDLIIFGLLVGPASIYIVVNSDNYYYDCSDLYNDPELTNSGCSENARPFQSANFAAGAFMIIAGLLHFVLFIFACITVHRWRRTRKEERRALDQYRYGGGGMMVAGGGAMDPNQAYVITYANGQQVLVPPQNQLGMQNAMGAGGVPIQPVTPVPGQNYPMARPAGQQPYDQSRDGISSVSSPASHQLHPVAESAELHKQEDVR
ncbi:hypothetical protein BT63DRAFT_426997 [Microthyrium microscopicum]|uniref:MARVEL domain-containing protein n=1 Tax=Microthyrium microscopicum TaxID=703497 RepID=A0A6A6U533_9PEZI|nr:hypothetical protein BT63DRAFT_426997 [Microthyrium microscopicum]